VKGEVDEREKPGPRRLDEHQKVGETKEEDNTKIGRQCSDSCFTFLGHFVKSNLSFFFRGRHAICNKKLEEMPS
jgi:hypothetical protein